MKCPRCGTENDNRTVCKKCSTFLYRAGAPTGKKLTREEIAKQDRRIVFNAIKKFLKIVWMIIVILVTSFLLIALVQYLSGALG
ncbi:MAG TPA: hypothetical protein PK567_02935 [Bacillota bacterium]|nr:hypothetical protein [Bacillota bacterium]